jgi:hypothetical protein
MGRLLKGRGSQKTCLVRLPGSDILEKCSILPRDEIGQKAVFGNGFTLRKTETGQYISKGQVNWVQPFKPLSLEGFFCFTLVFGV